MPKKREKPTVVRKAPSKTIKKIVKKQEKEAKQSATLQGELGAVVAKIRGQYDPTQAGLASNRYPVLHIPTGAFTLDFALLGGIAEGFATLIYGYPSCGKTTIAKRVVANYLKKYPDKYAVWVDAEGMFDPEWAAQHGIDLDRVIQINPDNGNQAVDMMISLMYAEEVGIVVVDSVPSMTPDAILEKSAEDDTMGKLAQLMGKMCSKIISSWAGERKRGHRVTILLINQFRDNLGVMFGDKRTLPGGKQVNHMPTTKIELKNKEEMGSDKHGLEVVEYNHHGFKLTKTKHGASIKQGEFKMMINPDNEVGLDSGEWHNAAYVVSFAKKMGLVSGGGGKYKLHGISGVYRKYVDIEKFLTSNKEDLQRVMQIMIMMQRIAKNLPVVPDDGYLLASVPKSIELPVQK